MRLFDAFMEIRPLGPSASTLERDRLQIAARILLLELQDLARREMRSADFSRTDRESVTQTVAYRLVRAGPRSAREGDPKHDGEVRGWLSIAVRNASRDILRRRARFARPSVDRDGEARLDPIERLREGQPTDDIEMAENIDRERAKAMLSQARRALFSVTVPAIVARKNKRAKGSGDRFKVTIEELREAVRESRGVDELAKASLEADGIVAEPRKIATRRAAIDKRFQRAREACLEAIDAELRGGLVHENQARASRLILQHELYLQQRSDGVVSKATRRSRTNMRGRRRPALWTKKEPDRS